MTVKAPLEHFTEALFLLLTETFEEVQGIYLDRGTSLFETLAEISAEQASLPVSDTCASIAAQVEHVIYYLEVLQIYMHSEPVGEVDWNAAWQLQTVTPTKWDERIARLRQAYQDVLDLCRSIDAWDGENEIGGAMAIIVHTAYHLGEIRQATCTVKRDI
ncbi:MAG: hypothetical protein J5I90_19710 [Caldilineales bacterium]|nr:hypothetical protein [Caldilineales bacterium]